MKRFTALASVVLLSGCSLLPSKWDENQARVLTDIHEDVTTIVCTADLKPQLAKLNKDLDWFETYSAYRQTKDIEKLVGTLHTTTKEFIDRVSAQPISSVYCEVKKQVLIDQANIIGHTIKGSLP